MAGLFEDGRFVEIMVRKSWRELYISQYWKHGGGFGVSWNWMRSGEWLDKPGGRAETRV